MGAQKRERLKIDGYKCTACGYSAKPNVLMVHHLTYARLGNEDAWKDLVTLCPICHRKYIICLGAGKHRNNQAQQVYTHHKKTQNVHEIYRK